MPEAVNLKTGILRARFRNSTERPDFLTPGGVYELPIEIGATSNLFEKGHRIRLQVTSSCFPEFGRNLERPCLVGRAPRFTTGVWRFRLSRP